MTSPNYSKPGAIQLNVGCGKLPMEGWINLDRVQPCDVQFDLETCAGGAQLPFADSHFDALRCVHTLEHIVNILPLMQELHRVAKPGAPLYLAMPYGSSDNADEDPTHVRRFFKDSFGYFSQAAYGGADYGYRGDWKILKRALRMKEGFTHADWAHRLSELETLVDTGRNLVDELIAKLECVKPIRIPGTFKEESGIEYILQ